MKKQLTTLIVMLIALQMQGQQTLLDSIRAKGTSITSFEAKLTKTLTKPEKTETLDGTLHYAAPDKMAALFTSGNHMIINGNRMKINIGIFHGKYRLGRNKMMRSVSHIFLYGIQGRCKDFEEESGYTMRISQKGEATIVQFTTRRKHFLGLGYRLVSFHYDANDLTIKEIIPNTRFDIPVNLDRFQL